MSNCRKCILGSTYCQTCEAFDLEDCDKHKAAVDKLVNTIGYRMECPDEETSSQCSAVHRMLEEVGIRRCGMTIEELKKEYVNTGAACLKDMDENSWHAYACWLEHKFTQPCPDCEKHKAAVEKLAKCLDKLKGLRI